MNRYKKLCLAADRAEEAYRKFAPEGGEFPNREECRDAIIKSKIAKEAVRKYEQGAILMHDELTELLSKFMDGESEIDEDAATELLKKAKSI